MKKTQNKVKLTAGQIADRVGAKLEGDTALVIESAAPIESAQLNQISFVSNKLYEKHLATTKAGAVVLDNSTICHNKTVLRHSNPYLTFAKIIDLLYPENTDLPAGVHSSNVVEDNTKISPSAGVGPLCHIMSGTTIGDNCKLISSVFVGKNVKVGNNCLFQPGVKIMDDSIIGDNVIIHSSTVIGSDGFGFAPSKEGIKKIKQVGWVEIEDDVEIGSNVSIDRGALGATRIGQGTKIDNLVQIAHNVQIGQNCFIVSQVGISGSTRIGNNVTLAGQVGIVGHVEIGDGVIIGAQSGVSKSIPAGKTFFGYPARDIMQTKRIEASLVRLPDLLKRVKELEKKLKDESGI